MSIALTNVRFRAYLNNAHWFCYDIIEIAVYRTEGIVSAGRAKGDDSETAHKQLSI